MSLACGNKKRGCQWKGSQQSDLRSHEKACPCAVVSCSNGCKKTDLLRKDLEKHLLECPRRDYFCELCREKVMFESMSAHKKNCDGKKCKCPKCRCTIVKGMRQEHMDKFCPSMTIRCPYEGCGMELLVKEFNRHCKVAEHTDKTKMRKLTHQDDEEGASRSSAAADAAKALSSGTSQTRSRVCNII